VPAAPRVARREDGGKRKDEPPGIHLRLVFPLAAVLPLAGPRGRPRRLSMPPLRSSSVPPFLRSSVVMGVPFPPYPPLTPSLNLLDQFGISFGSKFLFEKFNFSVYARCRPSFERNLHGQIDDGANYNDGTCQKCCIEHSKTETCGAHESRKET